MDRFSARRKLLRGSLSAPLVLTVTAAGAQVRTTFGACLRKTAEEAPPEARLSDFTGINMWGDTWYRVPIWITRVYYRQTNVEELYIPFFTDRGRPRHYFRLVAGAEYTSPPEGPMPLPPNNANTEVTPNYKQVAALAFLDQNGGLVGFAWQENEGAFTTKSCYGSVYG